MSLATARLVAHLAGPVPDDIQHFAYESFEATSTAEITSTDVHVGLVTALSRLENIYFDVYGLLSVGQRRVLRQLAEQSTAMPGSGEFVRRTGLANASSVKKASDALVDAELVVVRGGVRQIADPLWLPRYVESLAKDRRVTGVRDDGYPGRVPISANEKTLLGEAAQHLVSSRLTLRGYAASQAPPSDQGGRIQDVDALLSTSCDD